MSGLIRATVGLLLGAATAVVELAFLTVAAVGAAYSLAFSRGERTVPGVIGTGAHLFAEVERGRLERFLGSENSDDYGVLRALAYLVLRVPVGLLGGVILLLIGYGAAAGTGLVVGWLLGREPDGIAPSPLIITYLVVAGLVLFFLAVQGLVGVVALERRLARRCFGPSPLEAYERRIAQLSTSRAEVVDAVDDERRRIERDLHDGVQQRLVGLAMLIGRARRAGDPDRVAELIGQAHEESQLALNDLREVAWRVYPAALDEEGLPAALETVAERSAVPVEIDCALTSRPARPVETVAYFVVSEAVTNAAKHSGAGRVTVTVAERDTMIVVRIEDDGAGGADPAGALNFVDSRRESTKFRASGLAGLARRVAALDGRFGVHSPPGGPTVITAELPCG